MSEEKSQHQLLRKKKETEKKKKQANEKTKAKDGFACRLLAAFNFDALFAIYIWGFLLY